MLNSIRVALVGALAGTLLLVGTSPAIAGRCDDSIGVGAGNGEAKGRFITGCEKDEKDKPSTPRPVERKPSGEDDTWLETFDPATRAQIEKCLRETHSDLCYEGLIEGVNVPAAAREVVARLHLPDPTPQFGPDPEANQWHMLAVGYPLWLWTSGPTRLTTTATRYGLSFTLTAIWQDTRFEFGDGHSLTCASTSAYPATTKPGTPSPTCGYTYQKASPASGYTVRAHTNWRVDWAAAGQSGSLDTTYTGNRTVQVGELNALIVK